RPAPNIKSHAGCDSLAELGHQVFAAQAPLAPRATRTLLRFAADPTGSKRVPVGEAAQERTAEPHTLFSWQTGAELAVWGLGVWFFRRRIARVTIRLHYLRRSLDVGQEPFAQPTQSFGVG